MPTFTVHNQRQQADIIASKIPDGKAWADKYIDGTVMRNLLIGYGLEFMRLEGNLNYTSDELSLIRTQDLINDWEVEYGIAKSCFADQEASTLEARINNILIMIAANGTSTEEQFENIALLLGLNVDVEPGHSLLTKFTLTFPFTFFSDVVDARYTIVVTFLDALEAAEFTHTFPFVFGDTRVGLLKCFFNILKPANCQVIYKTSN